MKREEYFINYFLKCSNVLDIGCGEGSFLELLKERNINAEGVDISKDAANACDKKGVKAHCADALDFLKDKTNLYDGIYISHVVEHLNYDKLLALIKGSFNALKPDGIAAVTTPDIKNIKDITEGFWEDPTHVRPYPIKALKKVFIGAGFEIIEAKELKQEYDRILWKIRDAVRKALVGDYWGRSEVYVVGKKTVKL